MTGTSSYFGNLILNYMRGQAMPIPPANIYVALFNGDPDSSGTEVTTQVITSGRPSATFNAPSSKSMSNSAIVDFGNSASAVTITHMAIFDAKSSGNLLNSKALSAQRQVAPGDPVKYNVSALTVAFS